MFGFRSTHAQRAQELDAAFGAMLADPLGEAVRKNQRERLRALTIAKGDVRVAKHLMYGITLFDTRRILD